MQVCTRMTMHTNTVFAYADSYARGKRMTYSRHEMPADVTSVAVFDEGCVNSI